MIGNRACKSATAIAPQTASVARTSVLADALPQPRWPYAPRSCSRAFARQQNCHFYDVQTHTHQERQASVRRGSAGASSTPISHMFARRRHADDQERRVSARHGSGDALAQALPQLFGTLLTGVLANAVPCAFLQPREAYAPRSRCSARRWFADMGALAGAIAVAKPRGLTSPAPDAVRIRAYLRFAISYACALLRQRPEPKSRISRRQ